MATYCYTSPGGETFEFTCDMGTAPATITVGGEVCQRDIPAEHPAPGGRRRRYVKPWPLHSDALGVHPSQIPAAQREAARHGVRLDFDGEGRAILESRGHRNRVMRATGHHDLDAGYGDH
jgi:hypothetical protein